MLSRRSLLRGLLAASVLAPIAATVVPADAEAQGRPNHNNNRPNRPPPRSRHERRPPPRRGYIWVPGYWTWSHRRRDYVWVPGRWERNRPGWHFRQPTWVLRGNGWEFRAGGWYR